MAVAWPTIDRAESLSGALNADLSCYHSRKESCTRCDSLMAKRKSSRTARAPKLESDRPTDAYTHPTADVAGRPDVGTQPLFKKKKPSRTYSYDSSLDPQLVW